MSWSQWNSRSWQLEQKLDLPTAGSWRWLGGWTLAASVNNVFDTGYEHPGIAYANAGDDTTQRSVGYYNSVLPQDGRSLYLSIGREF